MSFYESQRGGVSSNSIFAALDEFDEGSAKNNRDTGDYRNGKPLYEGTSTGCFDDGLLFRIIEEKNNNRWSFYNDTTDCEMNVEINFGKGSSIKTLGNTTMEELSDGSYTCKVTVYPLETELFVEGEANGYTSNIEAAAVSDEYLTDLAKEYENTIQQQTFEIFNLVGENSSLEETIKACIQSKVNFIDFAFPPEQVSLQIGSLLQMKMIPWARPSMFLSDDNYNQARLFRSGVHPNNIDEGDLGDSWFIGAVSAVSEFPDKIRDLFRHPESLEVGKKERERGIYRVTFNKNGWWTNVVVDDYLPITGGQVKFAHTKNDPAELWVSIMEKAYAKIHGGYGFIAAGDPLHALQDLTGCPCSTFNNAFAAAALNGGYELYEHLHHYSSRGYQIILITPTRDALATGMPGRSVAGYDRANLQLGHVYSVLKVMYFPQFNLRLLRIRNPWADGDSSDWSGAWNKGDKKWKEFKAVREEAEYTEEDDGTFYMEFTDAIRFFSGCGVCFMQHPMNDYRIRGNFLQSVPTTCLEISVACPVILSIILSQDDRRGTDKAEYSPIMLSIAHGGGAMSPMRVDCNSGFDTDHPTTEYTFFQTREVSIFYEFLPENSPYLVVPRTMSMYPELPYVLGLLSPVEIGRPESEVRVAFRALAPDNRIFDNLVRFDGVTVPCETEFQARSTTQFFPDVYAGTILQVD